MQPSNMPRIILIDYWHPDGTCTVKKFYPDQSVEVLRLSDEEAKLLRDALIARYPA